MMQVIIALVKRDNLARHVRATDLVAIQLASQVAEKVLGIRLGPEYMDRCYGRPTLN